MFGCPSAAEGNMKHILLYCEKSCPIIPSTFPSSTSADAGLFAGAGPLAPMYRINYLCVAGLPANRHTGVYANGFAEGSYPPPGPQACMRVGDVLVSVDGKSVQGSTLAVALATIETARRRVRVFQGHSSR